MSRQRFMCPCCSQGQYFEAEEEGVFQRECQNEDCAAPLTIHVALAWEVWVTTEEATE